MKSLILATLMTLIAATALANDPPHTQRLIVKNSTILKYILPNWDAGYLGCLAVGNPNAADQFVDKYGGQDVIWADQMEITFAHGGSMNYRVRLSANTGSTWVHQYYEMKAVYEHGCYVSAKLVGESKD